MHPSEIGMRRPAAKSAAHKKQAPRTHQRDIFKAVNEAAEGQIRSLAERWLGTTRMSGDNLLALNPTRADKNIGSFAINVRSGIWADFATGDKGGDIISLYAYLHGLRPIDAARELAQFLGVRT